jgi:hypothetical protein
VTASSLSVLWKLQPTERPAKRQLEARNRLDSAKAPICTIGSCTLPKRSTSNPQRGRRRQFANFGLPTRSGRLSGRALARWGFGCGCGASPRREPVPAVHVAAAELMVDDAALFRGVNAWAGHPANALYSRDAPGDWEAERAENQLALRRIIMSAASSADACNDAGTSGLSLPRPRR